MLNSCDIRLVCIVNDVEVALVTDVDDDDEVGLIVIPNG